MDSHSLKKFLLVFLGQIEKHPILLHYAFYIIFEHDLSEFRANYFGKSLPTQNLANYIILCSNCHLAHRVIVEGVLAETFPFVNFTLLKVALQKGGCSLFDHVKWWSRISFLYNVLPFVVSKGNKRRRYFFLLLWLQKLIKGHALQEFLVCLELAYHYLFDSLSKTNSINYPESAPFFGDRSRWSLYFIEQREFSEAFIGFQYFGGFFLDFDFNSPLLDNIKACSDGSLPEDDCILPHFSPEHVFLDVFQFFFWEVVEDEVVFEAGENEILIVFWLFLVLRVNILFPHPNSDLVQPHDFLLFNRFFNHLIRTQ